jgi:hypothetical protein
VETFASLSTPSIFVPWITTSATFPAGLLEEMGIAEGIDPATRGSLKQLHEQKHHQAQHQKEGEEPKVPRRSDRSLLHHNAF